MPIEPYARKVQYYEVDMMEIVHHSHPPRWMEEARLDYLEKVGYPYARIAASPYDLAVLDLQCAYHSPARFADTVLIVCHVQKFSASRLVVGYTMKDSVTGTLRYSGSVTLCCFETAVGRVAAFPHALPELYDLLKKHEVPQT